MVWTGCSHIEPHEQLRHRGRFCGSGSARPAGGSLLPLKDCMPPPISFAMVAGQLGRSSGIGGRGQMVEFGQFVQSAVSAAGLIGAGLREIRSTGKASCTITL